MAHRSGVRVTCPDCGTRCTVADHAPERTWRHLDTMQFATEIWGAGASIGLYEVRGEDHGGTVGGEALSLYDSVRGLCDRGVADEPGCKGSFGLAGAELA